MPIESAMQKASWFDAQGGSEASHKCLCAKSPRSAGLRTVLFAA